MKTRIALLREIGVPRPCTRSRPIEVVGADLDDPGPGEMRVRVAAAGLCHSDLLVINGDRPRAMALALGHEAAGVVEVVGEGLDRFEPGDHHAVDPAAPGAAERIAELTGGGVDVAVELAGSAAALRFAYDIVRRGGIAVTDGLPPPSRPDQRAVRAPRHRGGDPPGRRLRPTRGFPSGIVASVLSSFLHPLQSRKGAAMRATLVIGISAALVAGSLRGAAAQEGYDNPHADEPVGDVEAMYSGDLLPDLAVSTCRNIHRLFPTRTVEAGGDVRPLPASGRSLGPVAVELDGETYDLNDALALDSVTGLIVLKGGEVVHEVYQRGNTPRTRWMSMSVVKSITSTLVGAALHDGHIGSCDDDVTDYVPELAGSAYEGVSIRDILLMASGVAWDETYTNPASDRRDLLRAQLAQEDGALMEVMAGLDRAGDPGTIHTYSTGETQVLGEVVRGAVGMPVSRYLAEKIRTPYGMETDAEWWLDAPGGVVIGGSGLSATLRDYARFGQFFLEGGMAGGTRVLPEGWTETAGRPQDLSTGETIDYGYMWWPAWTEASREDEAFAAVGIQGQYVYVNPAEQVVIAMTSAQPEPLGREPVEAMAFFDTLVAAIE